MSQLYIGLCVVTVAVGSAGWAGAASAEVDGAEVKRIGNLVQHIAAGQIRADENVDAYVEAMGPPASDADRWFISVLTKPGCTACARLKKDWTRSPWLLALANPKDPKESWAHYNVFSMEDRSQSWRFKDITVTEYPTVMVQPPRNRKYGAPETVVFQDTYGGDPKELATEITRAIRQYVTKLESVQPVACVAEEKSRRIHLTKAGVCPPWNPPPKDEPILPDARPRFPPVRIPPIPVEHQFHFPWKALVGAATTTITVVATVVVIVWLVRYVQANLSPPRKRRKRDDDPVMPLLKKLEQMAESQQKPKRAPRARRKPAAAKS